MQHSEVSLYGIRPCDSLLLFTVKLQVISLLSEGQSAFYYSVSNNTSSVKQFASSVYKTRVVKLVNIKMDEASKAIYDTLPENSWVKSSFVTDSQLFTLIKCENGSKRVKLHFKCLVCPDDSRVIIAYPSTNANLRGHIQVRILYFCASKKGMH